MHPDHARWPVWGSYRMDELACLTGTPAWIIDLRHVQNRIDNIRKILERLPYTISIDYCVKTCPFPPLLFRVKQSRVGLMLTCSSELNLAKLSLPENVTFHMPVLSDRELFILQERRIPRIVIYQPQDIEALLQAGILPSSLRIFIRVSPPLSYRERGLPGYYAQRFGIPLKETGNIIKQLRSKFPGLDIKGIAVHFGTQISSRRLWEKALSRLFKKTRLILKDIDEPEVILGGGWPAEHLKSRSLFDFLPFHPKQAIPNNHLHFQTWLETFSGLFHRQVERYQLGHVRSRFEPGRAIVGDSALYLTRVVKVLPPWVFVDGTTNMLPESRYFARPCIAIHPRRKEKGFYHISGRAVNTMDVFSLRVQLPHVKPGDLLAFWGAGAYSLARWTSYASDPPALFYIDDESKIQQVHIHDMAPVQANDN